eukprot:gene11964-16014_t
MSLFVASTCQLGNDTWTETMAWSRADPIGALASKSIDDNDNERNHILFTNNEGEVMSKSTISHDYEATVLDWHPIDKVLAIGWGDGMISCWTVDGKIRPSSSFSNNNQHSKAITVLKWNPLGKRLVSGDKNGSVVVWAVDSRGGLNPIRQYKKKGEITAIIFCLMPIKLEAIRSKNEIKTSYSPSFFFGTNKGALVYADDLGHCADVQTLPSCIDTMLFFEEKSRLIIITRTFLLRQYHVSEDGRVSDVQDIKISVPGDIADRGIKSVVWAGPGLLAIATEEKFVRMLDIAADESYNISLMSALGGDGVEKNDKVACVSFSPIDRHLAVGTIQGVVIIWKYAGLSRDFTGNKPIAATSSSEWELIFRTHLNYPVLQLTWYGGRGLLGAVTEDSTIVLNESIMNSYMNGDLAVIQISNTEVSVNLGGPQDTVIINTGVQIKGLSVGKSCFVVWSGKVSKVYRVDLQLQKYEELESMKNNGVAMAIADSSTISDEAWFVAEGSSIKINNFGGTQKGLISFSEVEGFPELLDINGRYLAVITNKGFIKIVDINKPTAPKQCGTAGQFYSYKTSFSSSGSNLKVRNIRINCAGTRVAILTDLVEGSLQICHPDPRLHIYDRNKGSILVFDFTELRRCPISVFWDDKDDRFISCEALRNRTLANSPPVVKSTPSTDETSGKLINNNTAANNTENETESDIEIYLFFATSEHGILMQDSFPRKFPCGDMIGLQVPRLYFRNSLQLGKNDEENNESVVAMNATSKQVKIYSKVMRDFVGMDDITEEVKVALLDFSYNLTLGKLDEAYRAVKAIDSPSIWENMAQMCVKTKRLDVAEVCLGNMGHARGAAALRESRKDGSVDVSVGILAIQLGLLDDAARLFREANRYDLLNKLYQSAGLWDKAINIANSKDRIHVKTTHYQYAKHLESLGRTEDAIQHFEMSETGRTEVPRMLFSLGRVDELGEYVLQSDDPALLKWWAAYLESIERYDKARKYYSKAGDNLSLVRICCFKGDFNKAADIIAESNDRAAAYHFARQLENQGEYQDAINFYSKSGCYNHSIRLAKTYNLDSELMRFAMKSTSALMIECAVHFESKGEYDKAVQLYHKGGDIPRALDLCFKVGEGGDKSSEAGAVFDMLNTIAQDLGAETSPQMLARCADFLVQHKQYDKAIELYVIAKRFHQAVEMCLQQRVTINDDMVEKLTPPENGIDPTERKEILKDLAKALKKQGSYTMASKKYTQAGDRVRAIKCLVRSGDTKAVIQFTNISRNIEIYKLAANYLQQMNWRESVDIMKAIITFYNKAKAFYQLAGFYDSCAQVEIDEYRDYEKAIGALNEALKYLSKDTSPDTVDEIRKYSNSIEKRIGMIEKFVQARKIAKREPEKMVSICESLLHEPMLEEAIRAGDCLAMLVEHFYSTNQMQEAYDKLQEMESRRIQLHPYIENEIIDSVYNAIGINNQAGNKNKSKNNNLSDDKKQLDINHDEEDEDEVDYRGNKGNDRNNNSNAVSKVKISQKQDDDDEEDVDDNDDNDNSRKPDKYGNKYNNNTNSKYKSNPPPYGRK